MTIVMCVVYRPNFSYSRRGREACAGSPTASDVEQSPSPRSLELSDMSSNSARSDSDALSDNSVRFVVVVVVVVVSFLFFNKNALNKN